MPPKNVSQMLESPRSQTSMAYNRLRADILACKFAPDDKLKIADLAEAVEVSPGAIREALSRLVAEQLVVSHDQRGFFVAPLSIEDMEELIDLRCEIEAIALRRSIARGGLDWEASVIAAAHRLRSTPRPTFQEAHSPDRSWADQHAAFHYALVSACGSRRLIALQSSLYEQSERYRGFSRIARMASRDVAGEHEAIFEAAMARDADLVVKLSLDHFRKTADLIIEAVRSPSRSAIIG